MRAIMIGAAIVLAACSSKPRASQTTASSSQIQWHSLIELAQGAGERGAWQQNESDYDHVDDGTVTFLHDGRLAVAWVDQGKKDLFVRTIAPDGTTSSDVNVSRSPDVFSWLPRLASDRDHVYVLWQEIVFSGGSHGGEAYFARSRDGGSTFEAPQNLSRSRNGDGKGRLDARTWSNGSLDLAVGGDGAIYAAWTEFDGPLWLARSDDRGQSFGEPMRVPTGALPARAPALAIAANGDVLIAWTVGDDPAANIRLARSRDRGASFGSPAIIARTPAYSDAPKLAFDGDGVLHVAWSEGRSGSATIHYTRSRDGGSTFETARELSSASLAPRSTFPMLALDDGVVVVTWELGTRDRGMAKGLAITHSLDGGTTFSSPARIAHSADPGGGYNGSHQGTLMEKLALRNGQLAIANSALAHGRSSRVWLVRGRLPVTVTSR